MYSNSLKYKYDKPKKDLKCVGRYMKKCIEDGDSNKFIFINPCIEIFIEHIDIHIDVDVDPDPCC